MSSIDITLTPLEVRVCVHLGRQRQRDSERVPHTRTLNGRDAAERLTDRIQATCCERAVAKYFNVYPNYERRDMGHYDLLLPNTMTVDVKKVGEAWHHIVVEAYEGKLLADLFIAVLRIDDHHYRLLRWCTRAMVQASPIHTTRYRYPCYEVSNDEAYTSFMDIQPTSKVLPRKDTCG